MIKRICDRCGQDLQRNYPVLNKTYVDNSEERRAKNDQSS